MSKRRITITQADIDMGIPRQSWACAISQALQLMFPLYDISVVPQMGGHAVLVYGWEGGIQPKRRLVHRFELSQNASRWIRRFDSDKPVEPATFEMTEIPL